MINPILSQVLESVKADILTTILPELTSSDAKFSALMATEVLSYLSMWDQSAGEFLPEHTAKLTALLKGLNPGNRQANNRNHGHELESDVAVGSPDFSTNYFETASAVDMAISQAPADHFEGTEINPFVLDTLRHDQDLFAAEQQALGEGTSRNTSLLSSMEKNLTDEIVNDYLAEKHASLLDVGKVAGVKRIPGGFSKDTHTISQLTVKGVEIETLVSRRDLPFGPGENTVVDEYKLLKALCENGYPVAEPLICEQDSDYFGQPFMISKKMSGESGTEAWGSDSKQRISICSDLAAILAKLHNEDSSRYGFSIDAQQSPREALRSYIEEWQDHWLCRRVHVSPTLAAGFQWLLNNIPADVPKISLCHGDVGFHNILVDNGAIVALLDWEFAHAGDAMEDLCYCRRFIEPLMPWDQFLAAYEDAGGIKFRERDSIFYEVWGQVRNATCCSVSWYGFLSDSYRATKMAYQGIPLYRQFVQQTGAQLLKISEGA